MQIHSANPSQISVGIVLQDDELRVPLRVDMLEDGHSGAKENDAAIYVIGNYSRPALQEMCILRSRLTIGYNFIPQDLLRPAASESAEDDHQIYDTYIFKIPRLRLKKEFPRVLLLG